jgi:hypothetical protein
VRGVGEGATVKVVVGIELASRASTSTVGVGTGVGGGSRWPIHEKTAQAVTAETMTLRPRKPK